MGNSGMKQSARRALIIGGSGSLGSVICRVLAESGFSVAFTYYQGEEKARRLLDALQGAGHKASALKTDLADPENARAVVHEAHQKMGGLDALIIASGIASAYAPQGHFELPKLQEITPTIFDKVFSVNVRGVFFACQEAARLMSGNSGGKMVMIGSIDGVKIAHPPVDYACSKAALWGLVQALSKELGPHNILVNLVAPGVLEGGIAQYLTPDMMNEYLKHASLKRVGKFFEIANVVAFLAGEKNTYITGQAIVLDGGL